MVISFLKLYSILSFLLIFHSSITSAQQSPDLVIELYRHGARTPTSNTYDPYFSNSDLGQLTPIGMRQHYVLGKAIRETYGDFLPST